MITEKQKKELRELFEKLPIPPGSPTTDMRIINLPILLKIVDNLLQQAFLRGEIDGIKQVKTMMGLTD